MGVPPSKLNIVISFEYSEFIGLLDCQWAVATHHIPRDRMLFMLGHFLCEGFSDRDEPTTFQESVRLAFHDLDIPDPDMDHIIAFLRRQCECLARLVPDVGTLHCAGVFQEDDTSRIYLFAEYFSNDDYPVNITIGRGPTGQFSSIPPTG
jgi:hypothetical protein